MMYNGLSGHCRCRNCPCARKLQTKPAPMLPGESAGRPTGCDAAKQQEQEAKCQCLTDSGNPYVPNSVLMKSTAFGGMIIPDQTEAGRRYNMISLLIDTRDQVDFEIHIQFTCNVITSGARFNFRFQMFRQDLSQQIPIPVHSGIAYSRDALSSEANTISFFAVDRDLVKSVCSYSVDIEVMAIDMVGEATITDPVLTGIIVSNK